jgi:hypothetical protein
MMTLKDLAAAITGARATVADLDTKLAKLRATEADLAQRAPHTDDLVAWLKRSIKAQSDEYLARLDRWYFTPAAIALRAGTWFEQDTSANFLALPATVPVGDPLVPSTGMNHQVGDANLLALTHFLSPLIEAQLPTLVAKHFPDAAKGIKSADRADKLSKVRADIASLEAQRQDLIDQLEDARRSAA